MKIVQINATCNSGSTGKITTLISSLLDAEGIENYILYSHGNGNFKNGVKYGDNISARLSTLTSRFFGNFGFENNYSTKKLIKELERIKPDLIHIHNIHNHACNLEILFEWIKVNNVKVVWTFHDCWAFTGYCTYFSYPKCNKWKNSCHGCQRRKKYSWFVDRSAELQIRKIKALEGCDLTIVTPSLWLADCVKTSMLGQYPVYVVNNGIDRSIFKPIKSDFKEKHGINGKFMILGIAFFWEFRKGIDVFIELAKILPSDYQIVLVGTDKHTDKVLPENIISIHKTKNQSDLAKIYTVADVLVNPTREDNYPTVNMEALACGTPVVTFRTGGSPEIVSKELGIVTKENTVKAIYDAVIEVCQSPRFTFERCIQASEDFDNNKRFMKYIEIYKSLQ